MLSTTNSMSDDVATSRMCDGPPVRVFLDGSEYWVADLPTVRMGLGHFRPGWIWSRHAGAQTGKEALAHIGYIHAGRMAVQGGSTWS